MKAAILSGLLGSFLSTAAGLRILNLSWDEVLFCIFSSNVAALIGLTLTLQIEKTSWFKKPKIPSALKTWSLLVAFYLGISVILATPLQSVDGFFILVLPLILSTGFSLVLFGPIQDYLIRRQQRKDIAYDRDHPAQQI